MTTPGIFLTNFEFFNKRSISLNSNDIVVLVGPNNSGKSEALRNMKTLSAGGSHTQVVKSVAIKKCGELSDLMAWLDEHCHQDIRSHLESKYHRMGASIEKKHAETAWTSDEPNVRSLSPFFVCHLTTEQRLTAGNPAQNIGITREPMTHPIHYMQRSDEVERRVSDYFRTAFGTGLIVHRNAGKDVPLYCGENPPTTGDRVSVEYCKAIEKLPKLERQGDGMRSFVGVLLHALVVDYSVILIDEPEAFLHPPQARLLGTMLGRDIPDDRQLFIATHSGDIIRGLLDADNARLRIIRLNRAAKSAAAKVSELGNDQILSVWNDPLLRFSNILDGLFHEQVILCESDADCRFYAAMKDVVQQEAVGSVGRDVMFTHCAGKHRMPTVISALKNIDVPVRAVVDFDVLSEQMPLRAIWEALGNTWSDIKDDWLVVKSSVDAKKTELPADLVKGRIRELLDSESNAGFSAETKNKISETLRRATPWSMAKSMGAPYVPPGAPTQALERLLASLQRGGMFVVAVGEVEGFDRSIEGHGPSWTVKVLSRTDLRSAPQLAAARSFMECVLGTN